MSEAVGYLLDTNILLHLLRGNALGQKIDHQYALRTSIARCVLSIVSVGEMFSLSRKFNWGAAKIVALESLLAELTWIDINDEAILQAYGEIDHYSERRGHSMGKNDVWIAATARVTSTTLLTTDQDFDHLDGDWIKRIRVD